MLHYLLSHTILLHRQRYYNTVLWSSTPTHLLAVLFLPRYTTYYTRRDNIITKEFRDTIIVSLAYGRIIMYYVSVFEYTIEEILNGIKQVYETAKKKIEIQKNVKLIKHTRILIIIVYRQGRSKGGAKGNITPPIKRVFNIFF